MSYKKCRAMPLVNTPALAPLLGTLWMIEEKLMIRDDLVLRYESEVAGDGLPLGEGALLARSFWIVDNYVLQNRYAEAKRLFDRLLSRCNNVRLLAEEFDPLNGR